MEISEKGLKFLMHSEAVVLDPYKDIKGIWTIGVGDTHEPLVSLTLDDALKRFRKTVKRYAREVDRAVTRPMEQHQFDAFVSFHYNTGAIGRATFVKLFNAGEPDKKVVESMMQWVKPKALFKRRHGEATLFVTGDYGSLTVSVYRATKNGQVKWGSGKIMKA